MDAGITPGISVAVAGTTGIITAQAYGYADIANRRPLTASTQLHIASTSKAITAAAILQLDQKGSLSIDDPLSKYVPNYVYASQMTLRELLSHTSGIRGHNFGDPIIHGDGPITLAGFFDKLNATPLGSAPGTAWDYANENYYLLTLVVQNVTGQPFGAYLQQHVFAPARMNASYEDDGRPNANVALGYVKRLKTDPFLQCPSPDWSNVIGGGGVIATASDLARFDVALRNGTLLDAAHYATMTTLQWNLGGNAGYALGWFTVPGVLIWHEGDFTTASVENAIFPDGTAVVEVMNGSEIAGDLDRLYLARQLQNVYGASPVALGTPNPPPATPPFGPFSTCAQLDEEVYGAP